MRRRRMWGCERKEKRLRELKQQPTQHTRFDIGEWEANAKEKEVKGERGERKGEKRRRRRRRARRRRYLITSGGLERSRGYLASRLGYFVGCAIDATAKRDRKRRRREKEKEKDILSMWVRERR